MTMPKKWFEVVEGRDEVSFFAGRDRLSGLVRGDFDYLSLDAMARQSGLPVEQIRTLAEKFLAMGLIVRSPTKPDHFGYWHRLNRFS